MTIRSRPPHRQVDGECEFVADTNRLPLLITTWFGSPSMALAESYARWFADVIERSRAGGRRFVILDDASRAGRPVPRVRGILSKIECPPDVVVDRVVVVDSPAIRGAITALSWIKGNTIQTAPTLEQGVRACLDILERAKITLPREFELEPAQPSSR